MRKGFLLAGLLALGGCFEDAAPKGEAAARPGGDAQRARAEAEKQIRTAARDPQGLRFRAVETYRQSIPDTYAVCGQATAMGGSVYVPFVSVVSVKNGLAVEQHIARNNTEATRVYVELVGRCFEGGGPQGRGTGSPMAQLPPPLPNGLPILDQVPQEAARDPSQAPDLLTVSATPAAIANGTVQMRQNGNIRSSPNGGGAVLRVARAGAALTVFGTAPGGWYQVGETAPEGWVHRSMASTPSGALASAQ